MLVPYTETWKDDKKRIPFNKVVEALDNDADFLEMTGYLSRCIALVAEISTSQKDFGPTSFEKLYPLSGVHAEVISGILKGRDKKAFIGCASLPYKILVMLLLLCAAFFCINIKKDAFFHLGFFLPLLIFSCVTLLSPRPGGTHYAGMEN
jgi:hypothetical protein